MASDGSPVAISGASAVQSIQAAETAKFQPATGKTLPSGGNATAAAAASIAAAGNAIPQSSNAATPTAVTAPTVSRGTGTSAGNNTTTSANSTAKAAQAKSTAASASDSQSVVDQINRHLNSSGRADSFRVSPDSDKYIQQVNPANGAVVAEYSVDEFPALARSIGAAGLLIDDVA